MKKTAWDKSAGEFWNKHWRQLDDSLRLERAPETNAVMPVDKGMFRPIRSGNEQFDISACRRDDERNGDMDPVYLEGLYERATGEPPHEILVLENGVLIETGVLGSYDDFPNGYLPILLYRARNGWIVFDTGHSAPKARLLPGDVRRDGDILYLESESLGELQISITTLVRVLRDLNEG